MNAVQDILNYAQDHNIQLSVNGEKLKVSAPKEEPLDDFLAIAKQLKPDLIVMVHIQAACRGIDISPEQFFALINKEDQDLIKAGEFPPDYLKGYAKSFAEGIRTGRIVFHPANNDLIRHD